MDDRSDEEEQFLILQAFVLTEYIRAQQAKLREVKKRLRVLKK